MRFYHGVFCCGLVPTRFPNILQDYLTSIVCQFHGISHACMRISAQVSTEGYDISVPMVNWSPSSKMSTVNHNAVDFGDAPFEDKHGKHPTSFLHPTEWLDALRTDDVESAAAFLRDASAKYKDFLMNGDIATLNSNCLDPSQRHPSHKRSSMEFAIIKPLHAAAVFHSHAVLRLLSTSGVDIQQMDCWKNNVLHMLIFADSVANVRKTKYAETLAYLQDLLSENDMRSLLMAENELALRPLEFAALHGCASLASVIMHTKGVYLIKEESVGYDVVQYFDVSDYELFNDGLPPRFFNSPLALLVTNENSRIGLTSNTIFRDPGFKSWTHSKIMMNWPFVFIWFLFRICYIVLFVSASTENSWPTVITNGSNNTEEIVICPCQASDRGSYRWGTLALISLVIVMYDLYSCIRIRTLHHPGARFTNDFLPAIQIRWKLRLAVIPLLAIRSQQIFAHATTAQLSCHVQNFVAITVLESRWEWNEISIEFELRWKNR